MRDIMRHYVKQIDSLNQQPEPDAGERGVPSAGERRAYPCAGGRRACFRTLNRVKVGAIVRARDIVLTA